MWPVRARADAAAGCPELWGVMRWAREHPRRRHPQPHSHAKRRGEQRAPLAHALAADPSDTHETFTSCTAAPRVNKGGPLCSAIRPHKPARPAPLTARRSPAAPPTPSRPPHPAHRKTPDQRPISIRDKTRMCVADLQVGVDDAVPVQIVGVGLAVPRRVVPDRIVLTKTQKIKERKTRHRRVN